jgi:hypothetical protein
MDWAFLRVCWVRKKALRADTLVVIAVQCGYIPVGFDPLRVFLPCLLMGRSVRK